MQEERKDLEYIFRTLGIDRMGKGATLLRNLYYGNIEVERLDKRQLEIIRETWNTRYFIPLDMWECKNCQMRAKKEECEKCQKKKGFENLYLIKPEHAGQESEEEYNRKYVREMVNLLKKLQ